MTTFIVRVLAVTPQGCRGRVRHVRTGREESFQDWRELRDFLDRMTSDAGLATLSATSGGEGRVDEEGDGGAPDPSP